jgi:hypothetical protein
MTTHTRLGIAVLALAASAAAASPGRAAAASTYCSSSGDVCYGVVGSAPPVRLGITLAAQYFTSFELCVTGPDAKRDCRGFRVQRAAHGLYGRIVRWSRYFPNRGHGTYRARWSSGGSALGPSIAFRRTGRASIQVRPSSVPAGDRVRVFGSAGGCRPGDAVTLISKAFPHAHDFAGVPAVFAKVQRNDSYSARVRIPASRRPGRYAITARCGGGNFGVTRRLTVS